MYRYQKPKYIIDQLPPCTQVEKLKEVHNAFMVGFFAAWCPHCQHFLPEFERAQLEVERELGRSIPVYALDASGYTRAQGVPHLEFFICGEPINIPEARKGDVLRRYMRDYLGYSA